MRDKWAGGKRITEFYKAQNLKRPGFAELLKISYDRLLSYEMDKTEPSPEFFRTIAIHFPEADIRWLMTGIKPPGQPKLQVPILASIQAGELVEPFNDEEVIGYWNALREGEKDLFALRVRGSSMFPEIQEDDIALCSPHRAYLNGMIYAVGTVDHQYTLKRVFKRKDGYDLVPSNQDFPTVFLPEAEVVKLVRVVEIVRRLA